MNLSNFDLTFVLNALSDPYPHAGGAEPDLPPFDFSHLQHLSSNADPACTPEGRLGQIKGLAVYPLSVPFNYPDA
jgi:hypothetical protein